MCYLFTICTHPQIPNASDFRKKEKMALTIQL